MVSTSTAVRSSLGSSSSSSSSSSDSLDSAVNDCDCCCHGESTHRRLRRLRRLRKICGPKWCQPFLDIFNPLPLLEHIKANASSDDVPVLSAHAVLDCLDSSREYWVLLQQALTDLERVPDLTSNVTATQRQKKRSDKRPKWEQRDLSLSGLQMSPRVCRCSKAH